MLAAAMWNCPHVLVLDEPTNYLDLEALGALSRAIKKFKGGVVMVSHHDGFVSGLCDEVWTVTDGEMVLTKKKGKKVMLCLRSNCSSASTVNCCSPAHARHDV